MKTQYYRRIFYARVSTAAFIVLVLVCAVFISLIVADRAAVLKEHEEHFLLQQKEDMKATVDSVISEIENSRVSFWDIYTKDAEYIMQSLSLAAESAETSGEFYTMIKTMANDSGDITIYTYVRPEGTLRTITSAKDYTEADVPEASFKNKVKQNKIKEAMWLDKFKLELGVYFEDSIVDGHVKEVFANVMQKSIIEGQKYIWINQIVPYAGGNDFTYKIVSPFFEKDTNKNTDDESTINSFELEGIERNGDVYFYFDLDDTHSSSLETGSYLAYSKSYPEFSWIIGTAVYDADISHRFSQETKSIDDQIIPQIFLNILLFLTVAALFAFFLLTVEHRYFRIIRDYTVELENSKRTYETRIGELKKDSDKDPLTGLYNRRFMMNKLTRQFDYSKESAKNYAVIMTDIDFFKSINDTHGHAAGDYVLREVSTTMQNVLRADDYLARYGGEEFLILLTSEGVLSDTILMAIAEKLRRCVEERKILFEGKELRVTMSFGVSSFYITDESFSDAVRRADNALYESKARGRNRVTINDQ